jgi:hypothetical protein
MPKLAAMKKTGKIKGPRVSGPFMVYDIKLIIRV